MKRLSDFFPSDTSRDSLLEIQRCVAQSVIVEDRFPELHNIAGVDQAFIDGKIISGIVVLNYPSLEVVERVYSVLPLEFPYIPTFLSFREGPAIVAAFQELKNTPDILMVDGAGINHPRNAGIATHIGVALTIPTIGITKKILCGSGEEPSSAGDANPLIYEGKPVGWLLKSKKLSRAITVAPGHMVSLERSLSITRQCLRGHKLPEPLRCAHAYSSGLKKRLL